MEFLEIGEKIKRTRKELNMRQRELEDVNMTRALISMIEIGKRKPSKESMESIIKKFQKRAKELNKSFNLESSYFLRNAKEDAGIYCTKIINSTTNIHEIVAAIEIANKYGLTPIISDAYLKLADIKFDKLDYINSHVDYLIALDNYKNINFNEKIPYIYNRLGRCYINQTLNIQALNYFNLAYHYSIMYHDEDIKKKSIYNIALCNKKLGKIEDAINYIDIYISICNKEKDFLVYSYANILKANCYDCKGEINRAVEVLNNLLEESTDRNHPIIGNINNNLGVLYCKQGNFEKSLQYFNISQEIRSEKDMQNLSHTLIEKSVLYIKENLYLESISLIKSAIELAIKYNDIEYILKGHYELIKVYKILKLDEEIKNSYMKVLNLLIDNGSENHKEEVVKICVELLRISLSQNNIEQSNNILDILESVYKK